jgi:hypothetical protein
VEVGVIILVASKEVDIAVVLLLPLIVFRLTRSTPTSSYCAFPYNTPKREVKEEEEIQAPRCRLRSGDDIMICEPKVKLKEEEERDKVAVLLSEQRLNATSDDPNDTLGFNVVFMVSLNDHIA